MRTLAGTGELVRLNFRLDRVRIPLWSAGVLGLILVSAISVKSLYPTAADVAGYVDLMNISPNLVAVNRALNGPGIGFDHPNLGVVLVNEIAIWGSLAFALMGVFLMARHTRADEEAERTEALRARMVGRHAPLAAASACVAAVQVLVGLAAFGGIVATGFGVQGTAALCVGFVTTGLVFSALTAVSAQVASTGRATIGAGVAVIGVAYLVRAIGDMGDGRLSWLSPIGWTHRIRPFAGEDWWVSGLALGVVALAAAASLFLSDRRDLGSGLVHARLGPARGNRWSIHPVGLALRLQRGSLLAWGIGLFVLGAAYGAVGNDIEQVLNENPDMEQFMALGAGSVTDAYLAYTTLFGAMLVSGFSIASVLRMSGAESAGRAELMLASPLSRWQWMGGHLLVSAGGTVVLLAMSGLGTGVGIGVASGDVSQVARLVGASVAHAPAVLVVAAVAVLLFGAAPKWSLAAWSALAVVVVIGLFGDLFRLPEWVRWISPLEHSPSLPAEPLAMTAELVLAGVASGAAALGASGFRRRDVPSV